jgi:hypothetical protein
MDELILKIQQDHPGLLLQPGRSHCWSPEQGKVSYTVDETYSIEGLLHELGHARLAHENYTSDLELLQKEVEAWQEALCLAGLYGIELDDSHIQDCLDTYRDWVYKRSTCPGCKSTGLQHSDRQYMCLNCGQSWQVSTSRLERPYRRSIQKVGAQ